MKAIAWHGRKDMRVDKVDDPKIEDDRDIIIRVTTSGICGSDLHLYNDSMPRMEKGDIIGHEPMGEVVEKGRSVPNLEVGDRVVVPFTISCGSCFFCQRQLYSCCDTTNRDAQTCREMMGAATAGLFGYSHLTGHYPGGQAEYLRVPYADVGPIKVPAGVPDERVIFLSDIFPTGYMAAENAEIEAGDTVSIWGCGPVGQMAIRCAWMFNPERVIAIDQVPERLAMARAGKAETIDFSKTDVYEKLMEMTHGRGPDRVIDAVGAEAHGTGTMQDVIDNVKSAVGLQPDHAHVLRETVMCCRKGGTISMPGVYVAMAPYMMGAFMNKGLTLRSGQTHMQKYLKPLMKKIMDDEIDPSFVITHRCTLDEAPEMYEKFNKKEDGCIKVVIQN